MSLFRNNYDWRGVENPATDDELRELIAALRSGDYPQTQGQLRRTIAAHRPVGFCCLGVANEVWKCGLPDGDAILAREDVMLKLPEELQDKLYVRNDNGEAFTQIADFLEKGFGLV